MLRKAITSAALATICILCSTPAARALQATGHVEPTTPLGQYLGLSMTIDDAKTRFEITGPDFSFFAFAFDTTTMFGYALIVEGTDANRTVVEQNLQGIGQPGSPQAIQNLSLINTIHDAANNLTTVILERPNDTGDPNDPDFSPSMTALALVWAYNSTASPADPQPTLDYHGYGGRGFATITFIPEPGSVALASCAAIALARLARKSGRRG